jgi:metal-responsive CopG/Arc/MetJ family transcriptional regulator
MPVGLIGEIDRWADCSDVKRSEAIRRLVELGLASIKPKAKLSSRVLRKATSVIDALASDLQNAREKTKAPPTGK